MDSSDDEGVVLPQAVSGYHFEDAESRPISFAELPVQWSEKVSPDRGDKEIYLRGAADNGLLPVHKQVTAWKYNISLAKPEISVLTKDNNWIKLEKPRKIFEDTIRTILITVRCLHFLKRNPDAPGNTLWERLSRVFSLFDPRPSENDLIDHIDFIREAVKKNEVLAKSKFLAAFLEEKPRKRKAVSEDAGSLTRPDFIVDDVTEEPEDDDSPNKDAEDDESDEENDPFDSVCAICDNGGDLLCCDGKCLRSFHATEEAGEDSSCLSLGFSAEQVEATPTFICENCQNDMHQCYVCGELGSSNKSKGAEVFQCSSATCGHFYHPHCVAKLLHRESEAEAKDLEEKIAGGDPFMCPAHKCAICKQAENEEDSDLRFATCRRCPKSYHRKCMPRKIVLYDSEDEDVEARAWPNLLPKNRILIYCMKHDIDGELKTPSRDHIKFPYTELEKKKKKRASEVQSSSRKEAVKSTNLTSGSVPEKISAVKPSKGVEKFSSVGKQNNPLKRRLGKPSVPEPSKKQRVVSASEKFFNRSSSIKVKKSVPGGENQKSLGSMLYDHYDLMMNKGSEPVKSKEDITPVGEQQHTPLDNDSKNRILAMMREATSSVTLEEVIEKHKVPTTHTNASRNRVDKSITLGKVERSVEALRLAVKKLDDGCSIEDAKAVCEPGVLQQIMKWKDKLRVYLAPFLHGMRYTSFGRHFTKVAKLTEIVDILHWYVREGDTIVDFCCGANDFSSIMKLKLDETGKQCSYKNYDVLQAKNDFNFEKRDWMTVQPRELPSGSQLIMGLNPPFGVKASLANKFIDKALQFKPKLLILIVPPETERLDRKRPPYDLIWEDEVLLAGKSFYLPGSVDVNDQQIDQWNVTAPPLYLWSRQDWTGKHKAIAKQHGHVSRYEGDSTIAKVDSPLKHEVVKAEIPKPSSYNQPDKTEEPKKMPEKAAVSVPENQRSHGQDLGGAEGKKENPAHERNESSETPKKKTRRSQKKKIKGDIRVSDDIVTDDKQKERNSHSAPRPSEPRHSPLPSDTGFEGREKFDRSLKSTPRTHHEGASGRTREDDDMARRISPSTNYRRSSSRTREDDMARGISPNPTELYGGTHGLHSGAQFPGYQRDHIDRGYSSRSYTDDARSSLGQSQRNSYFAGHEPGLPASYVHPPPVAPPSYNGMSTSTMQRYAPRLDELNHTRINSLAPPEPLVNRSGAYGHHPIHRPGPGVYDHHIPGPGGYDPLVHGPRAYDDPLLRPGPRVGTSGFAPGLYGPFSQNNSSGWLNE